MNTEEIINRCRLIPDVTVKEGSEYTELQLSNDKGYGSMRFFPMFPGVTLAYISVNAKSWPAPKMREAETETRGPLIINYCTMGRCELALNDNRSVFLTQGHISLTERFACGDYIYPGRSYEGIEVFIDKDSPVLREYFGIDIPALRQRYCPKGNTFIGRLLLSGHIRERLFGSQGMEKAEKRICMQTGVIDLLAFLQCRKTMLHEERLTFYTRTQVEIAKQIEAVVSSDLSQQHTLQEFARRFSVSESSIKNYFRGVYGQSIAQYCVHLRMREAAKLLVTTDLPVVEIAGRVGYENQSKFSAAFRKRNGLAPREYRRIHNSDITGRR